MKLNERLLAKFATDYSTSDREGFLLKKGEVNKGFQKRFFVLRGNLLFYFEKKQDREPVGVIILENCRIELCATETSMFAFQIVFEGVGTRKYVLAAETEEDMKSWMTKLTHAGHVCIRSMVNDLERRLAELQHKEEVMMPNLSQESSSDTESDNERTVVNQLTPPIALPKASLSIQRDKCKTLPPRRTSNRYVDQDKNNLANRWSLSTDYPAQTFQTFDRKKQMGFDNLANFSERTDFLSEDLSPTGRHFSMTAFTLPSFSELKKNEESEDLIDLGPADRGIPLEPQFETHTIKDPFMKGAARRAKSERRRIRRGGLASARRDMGGSLYAHKKRPADDLTMLEENHNSSFQHLHRLWGATIWTKVREYELQHPKAEAKAAP